MRLALAEAEKAARLGEVPIGAVAVLGGDVIGAGFNRKESDQDPTAHAEIIALRNAARSLDNWRLVGVTLYCTVEPCPMCAGAMIQARLERLSISQVHWRCARSTGLVTMKAANESRTLYYHLRSP